MLLAISLYYMDMFKILLIVHILGGVLGVGGATFLEVFLIKSLRDGKMDSTESGFMRTTAMVLRTGLFISIFTGLGLILISYNIIVLYSFPSECINFLFPVLSFFISAAFAWTEAGAFYGTKACEP